jgi:hypothetical protein
MTAMQDFLRGLDVVKGEMFISFDAERAQQLAADIRQLVAKLAAANAALHKFGQHWSSCDRWKDRLEGRKHLNLRPCSCGFNDALADTRP